MQPLEQAYGLGTYSQFMSGRKKKMSGPPITCKDIAAGEAPR